MKGRISERRLAQIQAISGLAFATFLVVHLINTALASWGQGVYDGYQRAVRHYYQAPGLEIALIVIAPTVHMIVGLIRWRRRAKKKSSPGPLRHRMHRWSGYVLMLFFAGHVVATRGPGVVFGEPADFSFLTFSLSSYPYYFYPYYALFVVAGAYHLVHGVTSALPVLRVKVPQRWLAPRAKRFWAIWGILGAVLVTGILALGGVLFDVDTSRFETWERVWQTVAPWLALV